MAKKKQASNSDWEQLTTGFTDMCTEQGCKSAQDVRQVIGDYLKELYTGRVPQERIDAFTDDFSESVCLRLGFAN